MNRNYTFLNGFEPHFAIDALVALTDYLHGYHRDCDGAERTISEGDHGKLVGLTWIQRRIANELADYLNALEDTGFDLPINQQELEELQRKSSSNEVRQDRPLYLATSN